MGVNNAYTNMKTDSHVYIILYPNHNRHNFLYISVMKCKCNEKIVDIMEHTNRQCINAHQYLMSSIAHTTVWNGVVRLYFCSAVSRTPSFYFDAANLFIHTSWNSLRESVCRRKLNEHDVVCVIQRTVESHSTIFSLQCRHNVRDGVSNHQNSRLFTQAFT